MIALARATVVAPGVLSHVSSAPPLTIREVRGAYDGVCALCLVGSAAGPLPGDQLSLELKVADDAQASLVAAGATIAQGRDEQPATLSTSVSVGERGRLSAEPAAVIVCAGARVEIRLDIAVAETASLRWRELVVLGRAAEPAGAATLDWHVRRQHRPLLRQHIDLSTASRRTWPGMLGSCRVVLTELTIGPDVDAQTTVHSSNAVTQRLAEHAILTTVLAPDAAGALAMLDRE